VLILGIDTSTRQGSVALLREEDGALRTLEVDWLAGGQPSETLIPAIAELLERHGLEKHSLSLIAVASGPGSFTGLRVGVATVKGFAEALSVPVAAVSVLEALAAAFVSSGECGAADRILTVLDAQRNELFFGEFRLPAETGGLVQTEREDLVPMEAFTAEFAGAAPVMPDEALADKLRAGGLSPVVIARPTAEDFARLGHRKFLAGERADIASLDANYLRRSEAELVSGAKSGIVGKSKSR
jgi:tRNA threonylcarbamoyladenosine biosynthesis protein TsaB